MGRTDLRPASNNGIPVPVESFVPAAYGPATNTTRRNVMTFGDGVLGLAATFQDVAYRTGFELSVTPSRCRLRISNGNPKLNTLTPQSINFTGLWWGTPTITANWLGDFVSAPTKVLNAWTADPGTTEYVSPWFTPPTTAIANNPQAISLGFTVAVDSKINYSGTPGLCWHGASGSGFAAAAGGATYPGGAFNSNPYAATPMDIRIEYEYSGYQQIGLYLGTSITNGYDSVWSAAFTKWRAFNGPMNRFPDMACQRMGHCALNAGLGGASTDTYTNFTSQAWKRLFSPESNFTTMACTPDYAVIELGINDGVLLTTLATFQANIMSITNYLGNTLGIQRVYVTTATPGLLLNVVAPTPVGGILAASTIAGATSFTMASPNTNVPVGGAGGFYGGWPGIPAMWYNGVSVPVYIDDPASGWGEALTCSAAAGTTTITLTTSAAANAHSKGAPIYGGAEALRQQYNVWFRSGVPNTVATIDMSSISSEPTPPYKQLSSYYPNIPDNHPTTLALYYNMAEQITTSILGI